MKCKGKFIMKCLLIIYFFLIYNIFCTSSDCNTCTLSGSPCSGSSCDNCRHSLLISDNTDDSCIYCNLDETNKYYTISGDICTVSNICNGKVIDGSEECVASCGELKELGSYCYLEQPPNTANIGSSNKLKCQYKYSIEKIDGNLEKYNCLDNGVNCGDGYSLFKEEGLCFIGNCDSLKREGIRTKIIQVSGQYECSFTCDSNDYLNENNNNKYCVESCGDLLKYNDDSIEKKCISFENCKKIGYFKSGNECIPSCPNYHYNSECQTSCNSVEGHNKHNKDQKECISDCIAPYQFLGTDGKDYICYDICPSGFINEDRTRCINSGTGTGESNNCFYIDESQNKVCYDQCPDGNKYYNYNTKKCRADCTTNNGDMNYHLKDDFVCYSSCYIQSHAYNQKGYICTEDWCTFYSTIENDVKKCFDNEESCFANGYYYINGNECLSTGCPNFKVKNSIYNGAQTYKCLSHKDECIDKGYYYYNSESKECWRDSCPDEMFINVVGFENVNTKTIDSTCLSACSTPNYYYIDKNHNNIKKCIVGDTCKKIGKYFFDGDNKCYDECSKYIDEELKYYFYNNNNKCLEACKGNYEAEYGEEPINGPKQCQSDYGDKYYYESDNILRDSCELYESLSSHKCVKQCSSGKVKDKICYDENVNCPNYFVEIEYSILGIVQPQPIKKCLLNCKDESDDYKFLQLHNNQCFKNCPAGTCEVGNYCYKECNHAPNIYIQRSDYVCGSDCGTDQYYEKLSVNYPNINICKEECDNDQFYISDGTLKECLSECPSNYPNIVGDNVCQANCPSGKFKILYKRKEAYNIYKCIDSCPGEEYYSPEDFTCYDNCLQSTSNKYSLTYNADGQTKRKCSDGCNDGTFKYYKINNKICKNSCDLIIDYDDHKCVDKCTDIDHIFEHNNRCIDQCPTGYIRYSLSDYKCKEKCVIPDIYVSNNVCLPECQPTEFKKKVMKANGSGGEEWTGEYECMSTNQNLYYYSTDKILLTSCNTGDYVIQDTYECVNNCNDLSGNYHYYEVPSSGDKTYPVNTCVTTCPNEKPFLVETNHCSESCSLNYKLYLEPEKKCLPNCPPNYNYKIGDECLERCEGYKPFSDNGICAEYCPENRKYYIGSFTHEESDRQKKCLNDCTSTYPFYVIISINTQSGVVVTNFECKDTCPLPKVYIVTNKIAKLCIDKDTTTSNGCPTDSPYISENGRECYSECPRGKFYINFNTYNSYNGEFSKKCLNECPSEYYFHKENSYECIKPEDCPYKIADYESRTCVIQCTTNYYHEVIESSSVIAKICLNECNDKYGIYLTPDKKCVSNCPDYTNIPYLVNDISGNCKCNNLFYLDNSKIMRCYDSTVETCASTPNSYKIRKNGSNQCLKKCDQILSVDEDICYDDAYICTGNSNLITKMDGQKKCECMYKYYYNDNKKQCLGETEECPRNKYIPETNGCVDSCDSPYSKTFYNFCLSACPDGATEVSNVCTCPKKWYSINIKEFICYNSDNCPNSYPLENVSNNQCLKQCRGITNYILVIDKCESDCNSYSGTSIAQIDSFTKDYNYADYTCRCDHQWYYDITHKRNICSDVEKECSEFSAEFKYIVKRTRECVTSCPDDYSYSFNNECFHDCESYEEEYYINTVPGSKICKCKYLWKYDENRKIICIREGFCPSGYVEIFETKECLLGESCPPQYPLLFNRKCYKKDGCPQNSHFDENVEGTCSCDNLWYKYLDTNLNYQAIYCLPKEMNRCIMYSDQTYPYQINSTKECLTELAACPQNSFVFNYICYENSCPLNTTKNEIIHTANNIYDCKCDTTIGYWYKYPNDESNRDYLQCGLEKCEGYYFNLYIKEDECLRSCHVKNGEETNSPMVSFRGVCYETCPDFTKPKQDYIYECGFYKLNEASNLDELRDYANIQVRELYKISNKGGYLFNNSETSVQIYGIDKDNNINDKNLIMKSNLAYIDLGTCTEKIYEDNNLPEDEKILVIKYDMSSININSNDETNADNDNENGDDNNKEGDNDANKDKTNNKDNTNKEDINNYYLINPIEYEFFSSVTGEKIDASICEPNEIMISYPISYTMKKFDNSEYGIYVNEYKKKFDIGKELHHKNNKIDIFNFNNSVYKDICTNVEIDGKDLVLEDRYANLYPNNITLCESNCTYYYTDYELGRINCKCNYKKEIDFYREYPQSSDLLNDPDFKNPIQSGASGEVIKCLSKLPGKESIINNEAFYYSAVVTVAEISMIFVAAFHGVKAVSTNITALMSKSASAQMNPGNNIQTKRRKFQNDNNIISTSNRVLNNPPRKGNNIIITEDDEEKKDKPGNIVTKKNLEIINNKKTNNNNIINEYENGGNTNDKEKESENQNNYGLDMKDLRISANVKRSNNPLIETQYINNEFLGKTEFMPMEYNFKYFKTSDNGIVKKIEKSKLPFSINSSTKYLLERKQNINYDSNYLDGPYFPNQNMLEIIDDEKDFKDIKYEQNQEKNDIVNYNNININNKVDNQSIKSKARNLKNTMNNEIISSEKDFITIKKINPYKRRNDTNFIIQDYNEQPKEEKTIYDNTGLYTLIKREQNMLRSPYKKYLEKSHPNILSIFLAEIMDKIYLLKICCFLKKFQIFSVHIALYLICHLMLLTLLCAFFTINTIKRIWNESNFPQLNFYLLYGFLGSIVIWIVYRIFLCLLDDQDKVKELVRLKSEANNVNENKNGGKEEITDNNEEINDEYIEKKYNEVIRGIKIKTAIFFIIGFLLTVFCFIYLVSFFAIYTGTKSKVFKMYYISLIEIVLIKILYGICLAALRIASEGNEIENIYKVVYICDKYIS